MPLANAVTFKGKPLPLVGGRIAVGDKCPQIALTAPDMSSVDLHSFAGKPLLISCVPSLDTGVCNTESRRFEQEAKKHSGATLITVSLDLPFAQDRWTKEASCSVMKVLSDYKERALAQAFGILIDPLKLLARSIFVFDQNLILRYVQLVSEMTSEPDYDAVLKNLK